MLYGSRRISCRLGDSSGTDFTTLGRPSVIGLPPAPAVVAASAEEEHQYEDDQQQCHGFSVPTTRPALTVRGHVHEPAVVALERDRHRRRRAVTVLRDDEVGLAGSG